MDIERILNIVFGVLIIGGFIWTVTWSSIKTTRGVLEYEQQLDQRLIIASLERRMR